MHFKRAPIFIMLACSLVSAAPSFADSSAILVSASPLKHRSNPVSASPLKRRESSSNPVTSTPKREFQSLDFGLERRDDSSFNPVSVPLERRAFELVLETLERCRRFDWRCRTRNVARRIRNAVATARWHIEESIRAAAKAIADALSKATIATTDTLAADILEYGLPSFSSREIVIAYTNFVIRIKSFDNLERLCLEQELDVGCTAANLKDTAVECITVGLDFESCSVSGISFATILMKYRCRQMGLPDSCNPEQARLAEAAAESAIPSSFTCPLATEARNLAYGILESARIELENANVAIPFSQANFDASFDDFFNRAVDERNADVRRSEICPNRGTEMHSSFQRTPPSSWVSSNTGNSVWIR